MREIKFRGRSCGEWYYGNLYIRKHEKFGDSAYIIGYTENPSTTIVDINTIGQFTGLHDKNGKEIYEGDIMGLPVTYDLCHWVFSIYMKGGEGILTDADLDFESFPTRLGAKEAVIIKACELL